jgi:hypothetical protein
MMQIRDVVHLRKEMMEHAKSTGILQARRPMSALETHTDEIRTFLTASLCEVRARRADSSRHRTLAIWTR